MSASQSDLSSAKYGYDFIVALKQASINAAMAEYLSTGTFPVVTVYYNEDTNGSPVEVAEDTMLQQTNNTNPFDVPSWTSAETETQDITNIANSSFMYAFKAQIGIPAGYSTSNMPTMVSLQVGSQAVNFTLLCSTFTVVAATFGDHGLVSFINESQPSGAAWLFTSAVSLQSITSNSNLPKSVQTQLNNCGASAFSVEQLLFDFDNAALQSSPVLSGISSTSPVGIALNSVFAGAYFTAMNQAGQPVLGYNIVPNSGTSISSPLQLTSLSFSANAYTTPSGESGPAVPANLNTLVYLCATDKDKLPAAAAFTWNWVEQTDSSDCNGVVSVNRNTLAKYFEETLTPYVEENCYLPSVHVSYSSGPWYELGAGASTNYSYSLTPDQPCTPIIPPTGDIVLEYTYISPTASDSSGGALGGSMKLSSQFTLNVTFLNNQIIIVQHLVIYMYISSMSDGQGGNIVDETITDTYTLTVNSDGTLTTALATNTQDNSQSPGTNDFLSFFNDLNSLISSVESWAKSATSTNLHNIPVSMVQSFVFPSGSSFTYLDGVFSEYQDLVSHIH